MLDRKKYSHMGIRFSGGPRLGRRSFPDIRLEILRTLSLGRTTVNDLSKRTGINWKTVDNHLIYLLGRGFAEKVFDSPYVKIFDITEDGAAYLAKSLAKKERALKIKSRKIKR